MLDASNNTLASSTSSSTCDGLAYTPNARGLFRLKEVAVAGTGLWSGSITTELSGALATSTPTNTPVGTPTPTPTNTPTPTMTPTSTPTMVPPPTATPSGPTSGTHAATLASVGSTDSYVFTAGASGTAAIGSCLLSTGDVNSLSVYDQNGTLLGSGTAASYCNWVTVAVTGTQQYTVTTQAVSGSGLYRSAWSINSSQVVWNVSGSISTVGGSQSFSFPAVGTGTITISTCGPTGSNFDISLATAGGTTVASAATSSTCETLTYTPPARGLYRLWETATSGTGSWSGTVKT